MSTRLATLVDELQSRGKYTFTQRRLPNFGQVSDSAFEAAVRRLKKSGRVASPKRGFFVTVPIEYQRAGCTPADWFIDDLMGHLGQPYYVGLLSAAALHGAAHQQPMAFQVITDRPTRPGQAGRVRIEFHASKYVRESPTVDVQTHTGSIRVSSPEATALDLVRFPAASGHLNNVATVLVELAESLDPGKFFELAPQRPAPEVQRLGYLLDLANHRDIADPLAKTLQSRRSRPVLLAPGERFDGEKPEGRWRVVPNVIVEADI